MLKFEQQQLDEKIKNFCKESFSRDTQKAENPDVILDYCLRKAWGDATQRERFKGQKSEIIKHKETLINILKAEIADRNFVPDYDTWHHSMCSRVDYGMTYGIWQKFINMTFKYMYCRNDKFPDIAFSHCHCPIDSIIAQRADTLCIAFGWSRSETMTSIAKSGKINWNSLDQNQYQEVRAMIQTITQACTIHNSSVTHPTALEFDFLLW